MKDTIIVDIDGTIADIDHRVYLLKENTGSKESKDWRTFHALADSDKPIHEVIDLVRAMHERGYTIHLATGRADDQREQTARWLNKHWVPFHTLHMRKAGDWRSDAIVKREFFSPQVLHRVAFVLEDRKSVTKMWRDLGLRVLQVEEGDY